VTQTVTNAWSGVGSTITIVPGEQWTEVISSLPAIASTHNLIFDQFDQWTKRYQGKGTWSNKGSAPKHSGTIYDSPGKSVAHFGHQQQRTIRSVRWFAIKLSGKTKDGQDDITITAMAVMDVWGKSNQWGGTADIDKSTFRILDKIPAKGEAYDTGSEMWMGNNKKSITLLSPGPPPNW
jgi:hypothetical protein